MNGAELLVSALENEGVTEIIGLPGEENLAMVEALRRSSIRLVATRHEQSAAFMAATHGRLTGRPGVCLTTLGPGALNLTTGAAYALLGAMPMVMITGQKGVLSRKQARFQVVDIVSTMTPLTKMAHQIVSPATIPALVREAFRVAQQERPGPVHLELPEDIAAEHAPDMPLIAPHPIEAPVARPAALDRAASLIGEALRPLIMLGAAASRPRLSDALSDFVRRLQIPFFNTQMGKGSVAGGSGLYMGTAALTERDYVHDAIDRADLIVAIGHDTVEKPPFLMGPKGPRVLHVGYLPATVEEVFFPNAELIGDVGPTLGLLAERLEGKLPNAGALLPLREGILARIAARSEESRYPPTPQRIVHDVRQAMPEEGVVCLDNGMYKIWFARNYRTRVANTLLLDNALATMGAGLPSAMTAAMLHPDRRVLAVCGDGGFMMNAQELETASPPRAQPRRADPARRRLRDDPLETGSGRLPRFRHELRQSRFRRVRQGPRREGQSGRKRRRPRACARSRLYRRRRPSRRDAGGLFREQTGPDRRARRPCGEAGKPPMTRSGPRTIPRSAARL